VWTNCYHLYPAGAAFGGYKISGVGRENHQMMLEHYSQTKNLLVSYSPNALGFFKLRPTMAEPLTEPAVVATPAALEAIARLVARGPVMFFQSGGCCDGSLPMCFADGAPFYIDHRQYEAWKHTQLILDVGDGEPEGFSLAAGPDGHFITRSRVCSSPPAAPPARQPPT